jgi:hypothetical protein
MCYSDIRLDLNTGNRNTDDSNWILEQAWGEIIRESSNSPLVEPNFNSTKHRKYMHQGLISNIEQSTTRIRVSLSPSHLEYSIK